MFKMLAKKITGSVVNASMTAISEINEEVKKISDSGIKQENKLSKTVVKDKHVKMCLEDLKYELDLRHLSAGCEYDNDKGLVVGWNLTAKDVVLKEFKQKDELVKYIKRLIIGENQEKEKAYLLKKYYIGVGDDSLTDSQIDELVSGKLNLKEEA